MFGRLVTDMDSFGFVFAFQVLPTIVFFGALMAVLYHLRRDAVRDRALRRACSRARSARAAPRASRPWPTSSSARPRRRWSSGPYIARLTRSELMACMTAGFATTAGGVLAAYVLMLGPYVPDIAGHLIACSVMCAPASLVIAKLMLPETEHAADARARRARRVGSSERRLLDAIATGTIDGLQAGGQRRRDADLVPRADRAGRTSCFGWLGDARAARPLSLELLLGWVFSPLAFLMGVPSADVTKVASLLGQKTVLNEFVAYSNMSQALAAGSRLAQRTRPLIASYALCGFANFGSIGIQIGGYAGLAPNAAPTWPRSARAR